MDRIFTVVEGLNEVEILSDAFFFASKLGQQGFKVDAVDGPYLKPESKDRVYVLKTNKINER